MKEQDKLIIGGHEFTSRFILGSGKYSLDLIKAAVEYAEAQINAYLMAIAKDEALADDLTDKLNTYQELKEQYLTQKQELKDEGLEQKSLTDPDSRRMKNNGSLDICYNVQSVVDAKNHFVVDISTTNDINDQNQLYTMAQKASELLEKESSTVLADTGY